MGLLPDTQNCRGLAIPTCITARGWRTCRDTCRDRKLAVSFEVGGGENVPSIPGACTTSNFMYLVRGPCHDLIMRTAVKAWFPNVAIDCGWRFHVELVRLVQTTTNSSPWSVGTVVEFVRTAQTVTTTLLLTFLYRLSRRHRATTWFLIGKRSVFTRARGREEDHIRLTLAFSCFPWKHVASWYITQTELSLLGNF